MKKSCLQSLLWLVSLSAFCFTSCRQEKPVHSEYREPTLEEIHQKGAKTLNEILLDYETKGFSLSSQEATLRSYGPIQRKTFYGFTRDAYLGGKPQLCYLYLDLYKGYYMVEVHSLTLEIKAKPFSEYEQEDSPLCGYIPTTYTTKDKDMPNGFDNPLRGCINEGYFSGGRQIFRTYYIKVLYALSGERINRRLPGDPKGFEWNIVWREAL